jgi:excisionase family DNA binding protein
MTTAATHETRLLTVPEVAERLRVSRPTVYRRIAEGELPALRIVAGFGPLRVDEAELERWLYGLSEDAGAFAPLRAREIPAKRGGVPSGQSTSPSALAGGEL